MPTRIGLEMAHARAALAPGQPYGDPTELNTCRLILDSVGKEVLAEIVGDYLDLLGTSAAVYEKNGDYAIGIFTSGWCRMMDAASRTRCDTDDNREALRSGQWHCHESCWDTSRASIETDLPVDLPCMGGIRIYAVPIRVGDEVIGSINFGYGDPPRDPEHLEKLGRDYGLTVEQLRREAEAYEPRSAFMIDIAKGRLATAARLVGEIVQRRRAEQEARSLNTELERRVADRTAQLEAANRDLQREIVERQLAEAALAERACLTALTADIAMSLTQSDTLRDTLQHCAQALVTHLEAAFARIWTLDAGEAVLELQASAGQYTHLDGPHSQVRVGHLKIGRIAQERRPILTNDVLHDPHISDPDWARREGMVAFAGHPLVIDDRLLGVMALFARKPFTEFTLKALTTVADSLALGILRKQAEHALQQAHAELETRVHQRTEELGRANAELRQEIVERQRVEMALRESEERLRLSLAEKEVLLKEIHHRVKNNLQIILSLLNLQCRHTSDQRVADLLRDSQNRIRSMALIHETLYQAENLSRVEFAEYAQTLTENLARSYDARRSGINLVLEVEGSVTLDVDMAIPCGLIMTELVSNCLKHAFPDGRRGTIRVGLAPGPDRTWVLCVCDNGIGLSRDVVPEQSRSLGMLLVHSIAGQLGGRVTIWRTEGTRIEIRFPQNRNSDQS